MNMLESAGDISLHEDTCSDSDTDTNYIPAPLTSAGSRRGRKSTNDEQKRREISVAKLYLSLRSSDRGWTLSGRLGGQTSVRATSINNFSGIDISQPTPSVSLSLCLLIFSWYHGMFGVTCMTTLNFAKLLAIPAV